MQNTSKPRKSKRPNRHVSERPIERDAMPLGEGPRVVGPISDRMEAALAILNRGASPA